MLLYDDGAYRVSEVSITSYCVAPKSTLRSISNDERRMMEGEGGNMMRREEGKGLRQVKTNHHRRRSID